MLLRNTPYAWGTLARAFHWGMAALFMLQWLAGEYDEYFGGRSFHVSLGMVLAALLILRLGWRLANPVPLAPPGTPALEASLARLVHYAWYALLIALPVTGQVYVQAKHKLVSFFGMFDMPLLMAENPQLAKIAGESHQTLAVLALLLLGLHVGAALKHHLIDRDDVLRRMWRPPASPR